MRNWSRLAFAGIALAAFIAPTAQAADLAPVLVVEDPAADHPTTVAAEVGPDWIGDTVTPVGAASDLVGVYVAETDNTVDVSWEVSDINELVYPAAPLNVSYYFEFILTDPVTNASATFSLRTRLNPVPVSTANPTGGVNTTYPAGSLQSNCVTTGTLITCSNIPGSVVTVSVDTATERVTASMRRQDLKGAGGVDLSAPGVQLYEATVFRGIAACTSAVMVIPAAGCDESEMAGNGSYTMGQARD